MKIDPNRAKVRCVKTMFAIYLKRNPETEFAVWTDALVVRELPVVVKQLCTDDLRLAVRQELVDRLEDAISLGFAEITVLSVSYSRNGEAKIVRHCTNFSFTGTIAN